MARLSDKHRKLTDGVGCCSVPMWGGGLPSGFCNRPAYGKRPPCRMMWNAHRGEMVRTDGKYSGYVPALACPMHGGPEND